MKILKILGMVLLGIVALLLGGMLVLPSEVHVERSIVINAPASVVFAEVNSLKKFQAWSPWANIDPETQYQFSGPESGVDSKMAWTSDHPDVGTGAQWIVESVPAQKVKMALEFEGFDDLSYASIDLEETPDGTKVTWGFDSKFGGFFKYFGLFMDGMLGPTYEEGLTNLKQVAEKRG